MRIIELTENQFMNYSNMHSTRNFLQTINYANMQVKNNYTKVYLGLLDDNSNVIAATLILRKSILKKYFYGAVPGGYLIDYKDFPLLSTFTDLLKEYLYSKNYIYLRIMPKHIIKIFDKDSNIIFSDDIFENNLLNLGYTKERIPLNKHAIYLTIKDDIKNTYMKFSKSLRNNIKKCNRMGITIHKGSANNLELFYSLVRKKDIYGLDFYKDLFKYFNNSNYNFELYFAKFNPTIYLNNTSIILEKEKEKNELLIKELHNYKTLSNKIINKKIESDKIVQKYSKELKEAMLMNNKYPNGIVISTCGVIKNNREIMIFINGYDERLRNIRASSMMIWEIIKKYMKEGYKTFNLGYIPGNPIEPRFKRIYASMIGFNGNLVEYPCEYNLVINKLLYKIINIKK